MQLCGLLYLVTCAYYAARVSFTVNTVDVRVTSETTLSRVTVNDPPIGMVKV